MPNPDAVKLSIITAHAEPDFERLDTLAELLENTAVVHNECVDIEHVVVACGPMGSLARREFNDLIREHSHANAVHIPLINGQAHNAASARNLGLLMSSGDLVTNIDNDDLIIEEGLLEVVQTMEWNPDVAWSVGYLIDMDDRGNILGRWDHPAAPGHYEAGELMDYWVAPDETFPVPTAGFVARRTELMASGGWSGIPSAEDFGMVAGITSLYPGIVLDEDVYLYRKHANQSTSSKGRLSNPELESMVRNWVFEKSHLMVAPATSY